MVGEGEVIPLKKLEPYKRAKMAKREQKKSLSEGVITERASNRYPRVQIWDPPLVLDETPLPHNSSIKAFQNGKAGLCG